MFEDLPLHARRNRQCIFSTRVICGMWDCEKQLVDGEKSFITFKSAINKYANRHVRNHQDVFINEVNRQLYCLPFSNRLDSVTSHSNGKSPADVNGAKKQSDYFINKHPLFAAVKRQSADVIS